MTPDEFNLRVYGILMQEGQVLVSDELIGGRAVTKFPGGGLEFGEGTSECLVREFDEEMDIDVQVNSLYYINDFFQESAFNPREQLVSIYYKVSQKGAKDIPIAKKPFAFPPQQRQCFRWVKIKNLREVDFAYPVDQALVKILKQENKEQITSGIPTV